jgi:RNA polymerase sigma factor (TIGR02999 family)
MPDLPPPSPAEITGLLREWQAGSAEAFDRVVPLVYDSLRVIAQRHLSRERPGHTLTTAGLVHEAYLALLGQSSVDWTDRLHFFAIASRTMRRVLVWHARKRDASKRAGGVLLTLNDAIALDVRANAVDAAELLALDDALERLEGVDARLCRVVECRHFGGMSVTETAAALGISPATVKRDWQAARAWLRLALSDESA